MSTKEQQVQEMTNVIAKFIAYVAKKLPDDVEAKIKELAADSNFERRLLCSIAPFIFQHDDVKMAIAMALFGGQYV